MLLQYHQVKHSPLEHMENLTKIDEEKVKNIISNYKNKSNKDLMEVMDFLQDDFEKTKELIIKLTHHLDSTENAYNKILEEYKRRNK